MGGRGWWISEFEASLVYRVSSRNQDYTEKPCHEKARQKQKKKGRREPSLEASRRDRDSKTEEQALRKGKGKEMN